MRYYGESSPQAMANDDFSLDDFGDSKLDMFEMWGYTMGSGGANEQGE